MIDITMGAHSITSQTLAMLREIEFPIGSSLGKITSGCSGIGVAGTQLEKFRGSHVRPSRSHLEHQYGFARSEQRIPQGLCGRAGKGNHRDVQRPH
ncbi:hypothetical protein PGT21_006562 [Puccinia graminis f. sp. tritici]|uniref:Uncharacterized protein n=1 Tax=Puccinia graminis f. sp. tritici TaxID=56615 RepID=A0A5B0NMH7_PUCGR|nr:hypothetical protein PGT21_006562 [Puccinia graminis f. sp. tritici]KAA1091683.1 hypothetical protein PGTUg99_003263 [Puccinia graminis f. sp. tritici]